MKRKLEARSNRGRPKRSTVSQNDVSVSPIHAAVEDDFYNAKMEQSDNSEKDSHCFVCGYSATIKNIWRTSPMMTTFAKLVNSTIDPQIDQFSLCARCNEILYELQQFQIQLESITNGMKKIISLTKLKILNSKTITSKLSYSKPIDRFRNKVVRG